MVLVNRQRVPPLLFGSGQQAKGPPFTFFLTGNPPGPGGGGGSILKTRYLTLCFNFLEVLKPYGLIMFPKEISVYNQKKLCKNIYRDDPNATGLISLQIWFSETHKLDAIQISCFSDGAACLVCLGQ